MKTYKHITEFAISKLTNIAQKATHEHDYELALQAISACSSILYKYNTKYTDDNLEKELLNIAHSIIEHYEEWTEDDNTVLFYDGFGLDHRGIAIAVCKAIAMNGYRLIYVSPLKTKGKQPTLEKTLEGYDVKWLYVDTTTSFTREIAELFGIIYRNKPRFSFMYSTPYDVSGVVVFNAIQGYTYRCLVDLTDHAFWLGVNAFDLCNGGRNFSASIEHFERGISFEKMICLDANLFVDEVPFQGLPFDEGKRFIFSGGQLYKTLGDENNTFYKIVEHTLGKFEDVVFLYAGAGDNSKMLELIAKFPQRVFLISERPDFYQIIRKCTLYLNTYPMFGGLMMRYAALAGKLPLTLKHENDSDGILIDQERRQIEYDSYDELVDDIDRLLSDKNYLQEREDMLKGAVVTEECYIRNIRMMIEEHKTEFAYDNIKPIDTTKFRLEYAKRFTYNDLASSIAQKRTLKLFRYFPMLFMYRLFKKTI